jgi:hypothetical protein
VNPVPWVTITAWVLIGVGFVVCASLNVARVARHSRPAHPPAGRVAVAVRPQPPGVTVTALDLVAAGLLQTPPGVIPTHNPRTAVRRSCGSGVPGLATAPVLADGQTTLGGGVRPSAPGRHAPPVAGPAVRDLDADVVGGGQAAGPGSSILGPAEAAAPADGQALTGERDGWAA